MMEAVTAVRYEKSAILREGLGARIGGGTPEEGPLLRPNSFFHFITSVIAFVENPKTESGASHRINL
ncbi:TPA: hypothetical protein JY346_004033 [Escherichia coli]|nr:hypothetical protein [Escherichia coli]HBD3452137.1 hypothetical protein [Escherichia coli]